MCFYLWHILYIEMHPLWKTKSLNVDDPSKNRTFVFLLGPVSVLVGYVEPIKVKNNMNTTWTLHKATQHMLYILECPWGRQYIRHTTKPLKNRLWEHIYNMLIRPKHTRVDLLRQAVHFAKLFSLGNGIYP